MKPIPLYQRERIFALLQEGHPSCTVAAREKVSHVSVLRIKKLKEKTGGFNVVQDQVAQGYLQYIIIEILLDLSSRVNVQMLFKLKKS